MEMNFARIAVPSLCTRRVVSSVLAVVGVNVNALIPKGAISPLFSSQDSNI